MKSFKILQNVFAIKQTGLLNQIWTVCALLVNFQSPLLPDTLDEYAQDNLV